MGTVAKTPAFVFPQPRQIEIREVALPEIGPSDVLVKTTFTAVSIGTEMMVLTGTFPNQEYPCVVGYQQVGSIVAKGDQVETLSIGQRVVTSFAKISPDCHSGCGMGHAAYLVAPESGCAPVPEGVPDSTAVYAIMAAVGLLGYQKCGYLQGQTVAVTGQGLIGQFAAQHWRNAGNTVYASDLQSLRVELSARYSADVAFCGALADFDQRIREGLPSGVDVLVETSGVSKVFDQALALPRQEGIVCVQGHYPHDLSFSFRKAHWKQLRFEFPCAWGGTPNLLRVLGMMATQRLTIEPLITHRLDWSEGPETYEALLQDNSAMLGVIFDWRI